jgi:hypothetical protein
MNNFPFLAQRLSKQIAVGAQDDCWPWRAARNNKGYGVIRLGGSGGGRLILAHRAAFEIEFGPIPAGADVLHVCDNPACCNPRHLSTGDHAKNMMEMAERGRSAIGRRNAFAKLSDEAVSAIRRDPRSSSQLASVYGVAPQTIRKARSRNTWRHVQ